MTQKIVLYDTTLRDGTQAEDVNLSTPDKIKIALRLDEFGIDYIEGGWPGSNPVDVAFFKEIANYHLKYARIAAFGSTHHPDNKVEEDPNLNALIASGATAGTIFGKSCERHAKEALRLDPKRNLDIIRNSVAYLKRPWPEVYFDAGALFRRLQAECGILAGGPAGRARGGRADHQSVRHQWRHPAERDAADRFGSARGLAGSAARHPYAQRLRDGGGEYHRCRAGWRGNGAGHDQWGGERCGKANLCSINPGIAGEMRFDLLA